MSSLPTQTLHLKSGAKINSLKMKKQVIKTPMDDYALSNAVIKCLTNLGGKVAILDDMMCPKDTYFIGIDMGIGMITRMLRKVILN